MAQTTNPLSLNFPLKILLVSTPVGPFGSGLAGGLELSIKNTAKALQNKGHQVMILAPEGSVLANIPFEEVAGSLQIPVQTLGRQGFISFTDNGVLVNLWERSRQIQQQYDLIVNYAYDWLPFYLTPFFQRPIAHSVTMASLTETMDRAVKEVHQRFPHCLGFRSHAQAATFGIYTDYHLIPNSIDLSLYQFCDQPLDYFAWIGRISPEKGLEDAIAASEKMRQKLRIYGKIQDHNYWEHLQREFPNAAIEYRGFLDTQSLQQELRESRALLMTPHWIEAFGNVVIEALACGVPVVTYRRGGPAEIVEDGKTGFLVEPDQITALVQALAKIDQIDRSYCRQQAEQQYSLAVMGDRLEVWFKTLLSQFSADHTD